jgi:hypothetical protein
VVEHLTHIHKIKGSNSALDTGRERKNGAKEKMILPTIPKETR